MALKLSDMTYIHLCVLDGEVEPIDNIEEQIACDNANLDDKKIKNTNNQFLHEDEEKYNIQLKKEIELQKKYGNRLDFHNYNYDFCLNNMGGSLMTLSGIYANDSKRELIFNRMYYKGYLPPKLQEQKIIGTHILLLDSLLSNQKLDEIVDIPQKYKKTHFISGGYNLIYPYNCYWTLRFLYEFCDDSRKDKTIARIKENRELEKEIDV